MWLPQLLVNVHCKLPQHIYLRCGHVHILTCYDWCKMNSDIEFVWRFYQESVTYGQCVQDLCRASPVGEICSSSQEVLLSLIPRSPLFFFCSGYVLYNTYKSGKWWKMRKAWAYSSHEWCQVNMGGRGPTAKTWASQTMCRDFSMSSALFVHFLIRSTPVLCCILRLRIIEPNCWESSVWNTFPEASWMILIWLTNPYAYAYNSSYY